MQAELLGRANLGMGALKTEGIDIKQFVVLEPRALGPTWTKALRRVFEDLADRRILMIYDEVRCQDRLALDETFLSAAGFADLAERAEVAHVLHDAASRMIWGRMAKSGNARESRMTYDEWRATGEPFGAHVAEEDDT